MNNGDLGLSSRSPHHHPHQRKDEELTHLIESNHDLAEHLARRPIIVETKDVPDTAGYSKLPGTVYIDRHLARAAPEIDGVPYPAWRPCLVAHEWFEKGAIDILGYQYEGAHEFATMYELMKVRERHIRPYIYDRVLRRFIKRDLVEKITVPPRDLDCTPYKPPHQDKDDKRIMMRFRELGVKDALEGK